MAALFDATALGIVPDLGLIKQISSGKARHVLEWQPREPEQTVIETAESMISAGVVTA